MIDRKQITYLLALAQERSITAAARKLYITQPALSRMLIDLERELGAPLFLREHGKLTLTRIGEIYLSGCSRMLAIDHAIRSKITDIQNGLSGRITLGVTSMTGEYILPAVLPAFEQHFPDVELVLIEERSATLHQKVRQGEIDFAFLYQQMPDDLVYESVWVDPVYLQLPQYICNANGGVWAVGINNPPLSPELLNGEKFILLKSGRGMRNLADTVLRDLSVTPGKLLETENIHLSSELVKINCGLCFMPYMAACRNRGVYTTISGYTMERTLYCCHRKDSFTKAEQFLLENLSGWLSDYLKGEYCANY